MFHAEKLRKAHVDPLAGQDFEQPPAEPVNGGLEYNKVVKILASRPWRRELQYRARWEGWDEDPAWYPASDFKNAARLRSITS